MNEEQLNIELINILEEAKKLREKTELENKSAKFLSNECDKLLKEIETTTDLNKLEELSKKFLAMHRKLILECKNVECGFVEVLELENKLNKLKNP